MNMHSEIKLPELGKHVTSSKTEYQLRSRTGRTVLAYEDLGRASDEAFKRNLRIFVVTTIEKEITSVAA